MILAAGLWLRLWGLSYGLPHPLARPDEEVLVARLLGCDAGDPHPHWFMYPTFYLYLLYGWVKALVLAAHALGLAPATALADLARRDPARLYLLARSLSVVLGTLAIAVGFILARALWDARAGLLAALLLAVAFLHVRDSHFFHVRGPGGGRVSRPPQPDARSRPRHRLRVDARASAALLTPPGGLREPPPAPLARGDLQPIRRRGGAAGRGVRDAGRLLRAARGLRRGRARRADHPHILGARSSGGAALRRAPILSWRS